MDDLKHAKARQRIARAIEHSYPRELSAFIDAISFAWTAQQKHHLHSAALKYARENYNAVSNSAARGARPNEH